MKNSLKGNGMKNVLCLIGIILGIQFIGAMEAELVPLNPKEKCALAPLTLEHLDFAEQVDVVLLNTGEDFPLSDTEIDAFITKHFASFKFGVASKQIKEVLGSHTLSFFRNPENAIDFVSFFGQLSDSNSDILLLLGQLGLEHNQFNEEQRKKLVHLSVCYSYAREFLKKLYVAKGEAEFQKRNPGFFKSAGVGLVVGGGIDFFVLLCGLFFKDLTDHAGPIYGGITAGCLFIAIVWYVIFFGCSLYRIENMTVNLGQYENNLRDQYVYCENMLEKIKGALESIEYIQLLV